MRGETLWRQLEVAHREATTLSTELQCFTALHRQEQTAAPGRIEALAEELGTVGETERVLQKRYEGLAQLSAHLRQLVASAEAEAAKATKADGEAINSAPGSAIATEEEGTGEGTAIADAPMMNHVQIDKKGGASETSGDKAEAPHQRL